MLKTKLTLKIIFSSLPLLFYFIYFIVVKDSNGQINNSVMYILICTPLINFIFIYNWLEKLFNAKSKGFILFLLIISLIISLIIILNLIISVWYHINYYNLKKKDLKTNE